MTRPSAAPPHRASPLATPPGRLGACALLLGALAGCGGESLPDPAVQAVVPERGWNGEDTVVTITGDRFYPQITIDAARRGRADLDQDFEAWLVDDDDPDTRFALTGVSSLGTRSLRGIVDAGLPPGLYDLLVVGPTGRSDLLPRAFTVSELRGDRLDLVPEHVIREVNQWIPVDLALRDAHGERVLADLPVAVSAVFHDGSKAEVQFDAKGGWSGSEPTVGGIQGPLGPDGAARFLFSAGSPGTYTLTARALDERAAVRSAVVDVHLEPASALSLTIELPEGGQAVAAGEPFEVDLRLVDAFGNPVPYAVADVALRNRCGGWMDLVEVHGEARISARIDRATDPGCPFDAIVTDPISDAMGLSAPFTVRPGPLAGFDVHVFKIPVDAPVVAGTAVYALVAPVDAWGNLADFDDTVFLRDSVGGVVSTPCELAVTGGVCPVVPKVAAKGVVLEAHGPGGLFGVSLPYDVLPEPVLGGIDVTTPSQVSAGRPFAVDVRFRDRFGNDLDAADFPMAITADDDLGEADCDVVGHTVQGSLQVRCRLYTARDQARLTARSGQLVDLSPAIRVVNGRLAQVLVSGPGSIVAGQAFPLSLAGFDAWGNPFVVHDDPRVDLTDLMGSLSPSSAVLGQDGTVVVPAVITKAGDTRVRVSQNGVILGVSGPWTVAPGTAQALRVTPEVPWAWTSEPTPVHVEAIDAWGNRTPLDVAAQLGSRNTDAPARQVELVHGQGTTWFVWELPATPDVLDAVAPGGLTGASDPLHVVVDCGADGPEAVLDFGGHPEAVACFDEGAGHATIAASLAASQPNGGALDAWLLRVEGEGTQVSDVPNFLFDVHAIGRRAVEALVVRDDLCAHAVASAAWVGPDDGTPVGPVTLAPAEPVLDAGAGSTQVHVRDVVDCSRDVAAGAKLKVRATVGEIAGAVPTGAGLTLTLDANGEAGFMLDVSPTRAPGPAALHAWWSSGAAEGRADIEIVQDLQRPVVLDQSPAGYTAAQVREIRLVFSEPLRDDDVTPQHFGVYGPYPVSVIGARLERDGSEVVLELDPPADGAAGLWAVHASQQLRDLAGNRLGGQWSDVVVPYNGYFGLAPASLHPVSCTSVRPDAGVFRPDGDPGLEADAEEVEIQVVSNGAPHWWRTTVSEADTGAWVLRRRQMPRARVDELAWDGRDQAGRIVGNGRYRVEIAPLDARGNVGTPCVVEVTVDNGAGTPR